MAGDYEDMGYEGATVVENTIIVKQYPKSVRAKEAEYFFGVKRDMLNKWVIDGRVIAWREDKAVFYDFESIEKTVRELRRARYENQLKEEQA
jgi:hypothetical protein